MIHPPRQVRVALLVAIIAMAVMPGRATAAKPDGAASDRLTAQERKSGLVSETLPRLGFAAAAFARPISQPRQRLLDSTFAALFEQSRATGLSACIVVPEDGLWRGVAGVEDAASRIAITSASRFHAGSAGKLVTAVLILDLMEKRRLTLESRLDRWLPELPGSDRITIDHLLSHTSGLIPNLIPEAGPGGPALMRRVAGAADHGLLFDPGHGFSYSNPGYMTLGLILEIEHGRRLAEVVDSLFIRRLGLVESRAVTAENRHDILVASTHQGKPGEQAIDYSSIGGAGILATTPADLVRALRLLLAAEVLAPATTRRMVSRMYPMQPPPAALFWGRGLMVLDTPLGRMFYLAGRIHGFGAMAGYLPARRIFVSVMVNDDTQVEPVMFGLVKALERSPGRR